MKRSATIISALLLGGILTACGSSSGGSGSSGSAAGTTAASSAASTSAAPSSAGSTVPSSAAVPVSSSAAAAAATITIKDFAFTVSGKVAPGAKVMVMNGDSEAHTVTADSGGAFDVMVPASGSAVVTAPAKAGSYAFHCTFHSSMHGKLEVG